MIYGLTWRANEGCHDLLCELMRVVMIYYVRPGELMRVVMIYCVN